MLILASILNPVNICVNQRHKTLPHSILLILVRRVSLINTIKFFFVKILFEGNSIKTIIF